jgi:hypothetical protein
LDFLEAVLYGQWRVVIETIPDWTHYRLEKISIELTTAHANPTMMHVAVKGMFFHKLLGIRAGLPAFS